MGKLFGGKSETKVESRKLTDEERRLIGAEGEKSELQLEVGRFLNEMLRGLSSGSESFSFDRFVRDLERERIFADRRAREAEGLGAGVEAQRGALGEDLGRLREDFSRPATASGADRAAIEEATNRALEAGLVDIERFRDEGLEQVRNVVAPRRGLRPGDSPSLQSFDDVLAESQRQAGQLTSNLRGQQAQSLLTFPLQRRTADVQNIALRQGAFESARDFQAQLREQAIRNRQLLSSSLGNLPFQTAQLGLGLTSGVQPNVGSSLQAIAGAQGQTQVARGRDSFFNIAKDVGRTGASIIGAF